MSVLSLWFGLKAPVSRKAYLASGAGLMALKMAIDNGIAFVATGKPWPLAAYLLPSTILKTQALSEASTGPAPNVALAIMAIVALPFLWIGVTMTIRRAADAGYSPWLGILFLVPVINYITMILFAVLPSAKKDTTWVPVQLGPFRQNRDAPPVSEAGPVPPALQSALLGVVTPLMLAVVMTMISVQGFATYGGALFFATPFIMGLTTAILYNRTHVRSLGPTLGLALLSVSLSGCVILLFAFEGVICLLMAFPIAAVLAMLGALVGYALASQGSKKHLMRNAAFMMASLPALTGVEAATAEPTLREVTTSVEIDAPPEAVWPNVVGFSDLPPPPQWFFRLGIAYPMRATIKGTGVGAVRHCEFSTGPFVEPITTWDEPRRLAFDVTSQPPSMTELSPYGQIDAPHLEGYMVSKGGEFRLVALPGGRTRLEGSTFYTLSIYPEAYWVVWGELLLHEIHGRVLDHIKHLTEHPAAARAHVAGPS